MCAGLYRLEFDYNMGLKITSNTPGEKHQVPQGFFEKGKVPGFLLDAGWNFFFCILAPKQHFYF